MEEYKAKGLTKKYLENHSKDFELYLVSTGKVLTPDGNVGTSAFRGREEQAQQQGDQVGSSFQGPSRGDKDVLWNAEGGQDTSQRPNHGIWGSVGLGKNEKGGLKEIKSQSQEQGQETCKPSKETERLPGRATRKQTALGRTTAPQRRLCTQRRGTLLPWHCRLELQGRTWRLDIHGRERNSATTCAASENHWHEQRGRGGGLGGGAHQVSDAAGLTHRRAGTLSWPLAAVLAQASRGASALHRCKTEEASLGKKDYPTPRIEK